MATWAAIRDAVQTAIVTASGLSSGAVIWKFQDAPQPALDYVALSLGAPIELGQDAIVTSTDLNRDPGEEVELAVVGVREIALQVEVYTAATVASAGVPDALERAERIRTSLRLPTLREALAAVQFVPFASGPVQYVPDIVAIGFRGRALLAVRCLMPSPAVAEYVGYIETVTGTVTATGGGTGSPYVIDYTAP